MAEKIGGANMIRKILCTLFYLNVFSLIAQVEAPYQKVEHDKIVISINQDSWQSVPTGIELRPISIGVDFANFYDIPFWKSNFSLGLGWGISSHNVHHNGVFVDSSLNENRHTYLLPKKISYEKNKHVANYLDFPIELRFKTKTTRTFRLMIGGKVGWLLGDYSKIIDDQGKRKYYGIKNIRRYHYGITGRIGWGDINFTMFYGLSSLFEDNSGPDLRQLSIGFSIIPF
ncbi:MAG: hypothetical protein ACJAUV_001326 [Flavobacteriales bacterium]